MQEKEEEEEEEKRKNERGRREKTEKWYFFAFYSTHKIRPVSSNPDPLTREIGCICGKLHISHV